MSTHTDGCFSLKSSGRSVYGIRWNQSSFTGAPPGGGSLTLLQRRAGYTRPVDSLRLDLRAQDPGSDG